MKELVGEKERQDIDRLVAKILRDLGDPEPPLRLELVRELLSLDLNYYSSTNIGLLAEIAHRVRVAGKRLAVKPGLMLEVIKKANLSGLWLPDNRHIYIDNDVPKPKHRWIEAHEITHSFVPWHSEFLLGDNELTLDPYFQEIIEAEANYGAGQLIFLGNNFANESRDYAPAFNSIKQLHTRYGNTLTSTFWRFVEERDPTTAAFGLISQHPHHADIGQGPNGEVIRKLVTTPAFRQRFPSVSAMDIYALVQRNASRKRGGPVVDGIDILFDITNSPVKFSLDGFSNTYQLLTYGCSIG